jgi:hypothetical protein
VIALGDRRQLARAADGSQRQRDLHFRQSTTVESVRSGIPLLKPRNRRIDTGASGSPLAAFRPLELPKKVSGNRRRGLRAAQISVYTPTASRCARGGGRLTEVDAKFFGAVEQGSHLSDSRPKLVTRGQRREVGLLHVTIVTQRPSRSLAQSSRLPRPSRYTFPVCCRPRS